MVSHLQGLWHGEGSLGGGQGPPPGGAAYSQRLPSNSGKGDLTHEDRAGGGKKKKRQRDGNWGVDAEGCRYLGNCRGVLGYHGLLLGWDLRLVESLLCGVLSLSGGRQREKPLRRMLCGGDVCWRSQLTCTTTQGGVWDGAMERREEEPECGDEIAGSQRLGRKAGHGTAGP